MSPIRKLYTPPQLHARLANDIQLVGFTCGTFDILTAAHVDYLATARSHCEYLIVAVNSDASVERYKGQPPIVPQAERMFTVAGLHSVNAVVLLEEDNPRLLLMRLKPSFYIKGADYTDAALAQDWDGAILTVPSRFKVHSSEIKRRCAEHAPRAT